MEEHNSLDFLQAVYRNPDLPLSTRLRAASIAIPFELPKLAVTAIVSNSEDFATQLDRALDRSAKEMRMLPGPITIEHPRDAPQEHPPSELKPNGFRRRF